MSGSSRASGMRRPASLMASFDVTASLTGWPSSRSTRSNNVRAVSGGAAGMIHRSALCRVVFSEGGKRSREVGEVDEAAQLIGAGGPAHTLPAYGGAEDVLAGDAVAPAGAIVVRGASDRDTKAAGSVRYEQCLGDFFPDGA